MANIFPKWSNLVPAKIVASAILLVAAITIGVTYYFTPKTTRVGYQPQQPVDFRHDFHVGQLGLDCRFCHNHVDESAHANIPSSSTCMSCHQVIKPESKALEPIRESFESGKPVAWVKIHEVPDYVYFSHTAHVNRGVSCVECHGEIDKMEQVYHAKPLSMRFCLDCHRSPEDVLRPQSEVYNLDWKPESIEAHKNMGAKFKEDWKVNPPTSCFGCHR